MVSLPGPGGFQVPVRFTVALYRPVRGTRVEAEATVEMIDGEPYLRAVTVEVRDPEARPLSAADLAGYFSLVEKVLDIHAAKGIEGVMDEMRYSERNARRLLARARKELP